MHFFFCCGSAAVVMSLCEVMRLRRGVCALRWLLRRCAITHALRALLR